MMNTDSYNRNNNIGRNSFGGNITNDQSGNQQFSRGSQHKLRGTGGTGSGPGKVSKQIKLK
jgi:hypothetical protein